MVATVQHVPGSTPRRARKSPVRESAETRARGSAARLDRSAAAPGRRQEARPQAAAPWHFAKHVSALLDADADTRVTRRHVRYAQRAVLWRKSRLQRVRACGRVANGNVVGKIRRDPAAVIRAGASTPTSPAVAHFAGLQSCGSIWACPVCSAKIRASRSTEISTAVAGWDLAGNGVLMVTLTFPHDLGMRLAKLLPLLADGFRAVISGRPWRRVRDQLGIVGTIRAVEVTHGANGWHPHAHVLVLINGPADAAAVAQLAVYMRARWAKWITGQGYRVPHQTHGVDVGICTSAKEAGEYVAKTQDGRSVGNELSRGDMKQGRDGSRTPFEILDDFRWTGDLEDLALWNEYEEATKGHQAITWSRGLRKVLGAVERTDEEIAAEEIGGEDVCMIPAEVWHEVVQVPGLDAALLDVIERSGLAGVNKLLARHGLGQALGPPGGG